MMNAPLSRAQANNSSRRAMDSATPVGNWCEGVTNTARARGAARRPASTTRPWASTGIACGRALASELSVGQRVAGILDPHLVAGHEQHADRDIDCLLGSGGNDDLLGVATHRARRPQIVADAPAQLDEACRIGVAEIVGSERADRAMRQPAPSLGAARIDQRTAGIKRAGVQLHGRSLEVGKGLR